MSQKNIFILFKNRKLLALICLFIIALIGVIIYLQFADFPIKKSDIFYNYIEGKRILAGENPYARILPGDMRQNHKYATYFPLFYWFSSLTQWLGFKDYSAWISLWRGIFCIFNIGIANLLFYHFYQNKLLSFGLFAALFWLLNRWTLHVSLIGYLEFIPIFFMLLSLMLLEKRKYTSLLLYSVSLAFKQMAIFLLPLYLIHTWHISEGKKIQETLKAFAIILSIPFLTSLPFIIWNAEGFFKSIFFSATRNPEGHIGAYSLDLFIGNKVPGFVGFKAKLPMLFLMGLVFLNAFQRNLGIYVSAMLIMFIFLDFNSVIFNQYLCWVVPLILLAVCDMMPVNQHKEYVKKLKI